MRAKSRQGLSEESCTFMNYAGRIDFMINHCIRYHDNDGGQHDADQTPAQPCWDEIYCLVQLSVKCIDSFIFWTPSQFQGTDGLWDVQNWVQFHLTKFQDTFRQANYSPQHCPPLAQPWLHWGGLLCRWGQSFLSLFLYWKARQWILYCPRSAFWLGALRQLFPLQECLLISAITNKV